MAEKDEEARKLRHAYAWSEMGRGWGGGLNGPAGKIAYAKPPDSYPPKKKPSKGDRKSPHLIPYVPIIESGPGEGGSGVRAQARAGWRPIPSFESDGAGSRVGKEGGRRKVGRRKEERKQEEGREEERKRGSVTLGTSLKRDKPARCRYQIRMAAEASGLEAIRGLLRIE